LERLRDAPRREARQQCFGIRVANPCWRIGGLRQFVSEVGVVIYLTIENHDESAAVGSLRLVPGFGQIQNGEPTESERDSSGFVDPEPAVIRSPVVYRIGHHLDGRTELASRPCRLMSNESCEATHEYLEER